jgi:hypothetical protein
LETGKQNFFVIVWGLFIYRIYPLYYVNVNGRIDARATGRK